MLTASCCRMASFPVMGTPAGGPVVVGRGGKLKFGGVPAGGWTGASGGVIDPTPAMHD